MKGSRITAIVCLILAGPSFYGAVTTAPHQKWLAIFLLVIATIAYNKKTFKA